MASKAKKLSAIEIKKICVTGKALIGDKLLVVLIWWRSCLAFAALLCCWGRMLGQRYNTLTFARDCPGAYMCLRCANVVLDLVAHRNVACFVPH